MTKPIIAFIGLGAMGAPMAGRLVDAGVSLRVYDVSAAAAVPLIRRGATLHTSPRLAATGARFVFACLPSPKVSLDVALGREGVADVMEPGSVYVEMSTIGSVAIEEIAAGLGAKGISLIDAPVSGGPRGANAGTLSIIAAGAPETLATVRTALEAITSHIFYVGEKPGAAQVAKLANNMISAAGMAAACEAVAMAVKAGVDAHVLVDVLNASTGRNSATLDKFPASVLTRTFDYGGKLSTVYKDVSLCLDEARRQEVPMWVGNSVGQLWFHAMTQGRGNDDLTTLVKMVEEWSHVVVGTSFGESEDV